MIEDVELLRQYAETRSEAAFAELVRRRIGLVYSVAYRQTGDAHRAQDVVQVVFTDLARQAASLSRRSVLVGWLYRSTRFAAVDVLRAEVSRGRREEEAHRMQEILGPETSDEDWAKVRPVLDEAMSDLNERDRDAILLRYFDERPFAEIGTRLRLTENAARMCVERALDKLHAALARRGIASTAGTLGVALAHQAACAVPAGLATAVTGTALTGAAAVGAGATIVSFMGMTKLQASLAAVVVVAGIATVTVQYRSSEAAPAPAVAAAAPAAPQAPAPAPATRGTESVSAPAIAATPPPAAVEPPKPATRGPSGETTASPPDLVQAWLATVDTPAHASSRAVDARELTMQRYGDLLPQLNLPPERRAAFLRLLDDKRQAIMDLAIASFKNGLDPRQDVDRFENDVVASRKIVDQQIQALLGESGYQLFLNYDFNKQIDDTFIRMRRVTENTADALTPEQYTRLHAVLLADGGQAQATEQKIAASQQFLSPAQVKALQGAMVQRLANRRGRMLDALPLPPGEK